VLSSSCCSEMVLCGVTQGILYKTQEEKRARTRRRAGPSGAEQQPVGPRERAAWPWRGRDREGDVGPRGRLEIYPACRRMYVAFGCNFPPVASLGTHLEMWIVYRGHKFLAVAASICLGRAWT
jgi:hypothetical protein